MLAYELSSSNTQIIRRWVLNLRFFPFSNKRFQCNYLASEARNILNSLCEILTFMLHPNDQQGCGLKLQILVDQTNMVLQFGFNTRLFCSLKSFATIIFVPVRIVSKDSSKLC